MLIYQSKTGGLNHIIEDSTIPSGGNSNLEKDLNCSGIMENTIF